MLTVCNLRAVRADVDAGCTGWITRANRAMGIERGRGPFSVASDLITERSTALGTRNCWVTA